jgi:hypothetical protein
MNSQQGPITTGTPQIMDFYNANSFKPQFTGSHVAQLGHIILIPSQPVFGFSP